ncbi:methyltransferase [Bifidobacterium thermophilum]|uniref:O-methyltransferase n=1 Tax=Bifidobacterium thermophilum TaxID=33905 RepID=UPI003094D191
MEYTTSSSFASAWSYVEDHALERQSPGLREARARATEAGMPQGSAAQAEFLGVIAHMIDAASAIVIGTGSVVETIQLLDSLGERGQLTTVDSSAQGIALTRTLLHDVPDGSLATLRAVNAPARVFLPRLNAEDYDLIVVAGDADNYPAAYLQAPRLLRSGGMAVFTDMLAIAGQTDAGVLDPDDHSAKADVVRQLLDDIEADERFSSVLTPIGTGTLLAVKR